MKPTFCRHPSPLVFSVLELCSYLNWPHHASSPLSSAVVRQLEQGLLFIVTSPVPSNRPPPSLFLICQTQHFYFIEVVDPASKHFFLLRHAAAALSMQALAGHSNCAVVRCILKPLADALVGVEHPEEPALTFPSLTAARSPSDRIDDDDDDGVSNATVLQRRVWSQSRDEARKCQATHLSLAGKVRACRILELVMPHRDTARATGEERKTVTALTWGVLKSQIFTRK